MTEESKGGRLGLWTLSFMVVANMIGAGVFTTSGFTIADLGSPHLVMAAWVVGGIIALTGAISYGQLARAMPESGGEYLFLSRAVHPLLGFIAGWVSLIAGFSGAIALAATTLESYMLPAVSRPSWLPEDALAVSAILLAGVCHGIRVRAGAVIQNMVVLLKLVLIAGLAGLAIRYLPTHTWHTEGMPDHDRVGLSLMAAFLVSLVWISLSYSGFNAAVYVAGEAYDPERTVPRALVLGTVIVIVIYIILNAIFVYAPPPSEFEPFENRSRVAVIAVESLGGTRAASFVRMVICAALVTSVISMMMAAPRVYAKMADDGLLPRILRAGTEAPLAAVLAQIGIASALVLASDLLALISYLSLTLSISAATSAACLFLPSVRRNRPIDLSDLAPVIYVTATLTAAVFMAVTNPKQSFAALLTFGFGALAYQITIRVRG